MMSTSPGETPKTSKSQFSEAPENVIFQISRNTFAYHMEIQPYKFEDLMIIENALKSYLKFTLQMSLKLEEKTPTS